MKKQTKKSMSVFTLLDMLKGEVSNKLGTSYFWYANIIADNIIYDIEKKDGEENDESGTSTISGTNVFGILWAPFFT